MSASRALLMPLRNAYAPLTGAARTLGILHLVDSLGTGLFLSTSTLYFVVVVGLPATQVGLGLSLAGLSGFISSVALGRLADKIGARRLLAVTLGALACAYALYPAVASPSAFFALVTLVGALEFGCGPSFGALVMDLVPEHDRVKARAALRSLFNAGFSAGALLSAAWITLGEGGGLRLLPVGNSLTFVVATILVLRLPASPITPKVNRPPIRVLRDLPYLGVVACSSLLALHSAVIMVGIPLWIITANGLPRGLVPLVLTVNSVLAVAFQVVAARGADTRHGAIRAAHKAGIVAIGACAVLALTPHGGGWIAAVAVGVATLLITGAELWQSASGFGLSFSLAPDDARGEYLGAFHLHVVIQATVGPTVVAYLVSVHSGVGWAVLGVLFAVGAVAIGPLAAIAARKHNRSPRHGASAGSAEVPAPDHSVKREF